MSIGLRDHVFKCSCAQMLLHLYLNTEVIGRLEVCVLGCLNAHMIVCSHDHMLVCSHALLISSPHIYLL